MLKDITLGQYFPIDSVLHKLDPRFKIIYTMLFIVMLFAGNHYWTLIIGAVFVIMAQLLSKVPLKMSWKSMKPLLPVLVFTAVLNLVFIDSGDTLWEWKFLKITQGGVNTSIFMICRIILLIVGSSLLTYTTSPILLTDAIESLLKPLHTLFKLDIHSLAMTMTIALRFIPTLVEEVDKIMAAQKSRGADMESGNILKRVKAIIPVLIPLFVSSFRRANDLAYAMECRCYRGGEGRTKMKQMHLAARDYLALVFVLLYLAAMVLIRVFIPNVL